MTLTTFNKLYKHYKDDWSMEMLMAATHTTYAEAHKKSVQSDEWF